MGFAAQVCKKLNFDKRKSVGIYIYALKLHGLGPIDNIPTINQLHQMFGGEKKNKMTCDMRHGKCDM